MASQSEIERPLQLYAWGYDENDMEMVADCLAEDAELIVVPDELIEDPAILGAEQRTVGRAAILDQFRASRAGFAERGEQPLHIITNILVDRASERDADVRCFYFFGVQSPSGLDIRGLSRYFDHLVHEDGAWRIRTRRSVVAHRGSRRSAGGH